MKMLKIVKNIIPPIGLTILLPCIQLLKIYSTKLTSGINYMTWYVILILSLYYYTMRSKFISL